MDTKAWVSLPGGQHFSRVATHITGRIKCCPYDSIGRVQVELVPGFFWTEHYVPFSFAGFDLYPFSIINHTHEYNSFSEFCDSP